MPYLKIETNVPVSTSGRTAIMQQATGLLSEQLGKSESYIMIAVEEAGAMMFGGSEEPAAYLELKSIGLPAEKTKPLAAALCALVEALLEVPPERTYIEFADAPRNMWGWNGDTFG